jgi:N-acetylglutamate synthase-like GNAT family acetyltransferase
MIIREANRFDLPAIVEMLKNFRAATPLECMNECDNVQHISMLLHTALVGGGIALVALDNQVRPIGMIIGLIEQNIWDQNIYALRELCFWVEPEQRNTSAGYRLLHEYTRLAKQMVNAGRITMFTMTKMTNSPDLKLQKFGYEKVEETWVGV